MNLSKGEKLSLKKDNPTLKNITVGAGWDIAGEGSDDYDLDLSAVLLNAEGKVDGGVDKGVVYFNNKKLQGIESTGDNRTGEGEGDDEQILVKLEELAPSVEKVAFIVNIFDAKDGQDFGKVENSFVRVFNTDDNKELAKHDLKAEYAGKTGVLVATLVRSGGQWEFEATAEGVDGSIEDMIKAKGWA